MKKLSFLVLSFLVFSACESGPKIKSQDGEIGSSIVADDESEDELKQSLLETQKDGRDLLQPELSAHGTNSCFVDCSRRNYRRSPIQNSYYGFKPLTSGCGDIGDPRKNCQSPLTPFNFPVVSNT